ncbi:MAG: FAD-dependent oxidoreductase [Candidatus Omnitrophota bacterium]
MNRILIIGGGFAGLSAAGKLCKFDPKLNVILIDKKETTDFLPMLPDCIGRGINPEFLAYKIEDMSSKAGFKFIRDEVVSMDLDKKQVLTKTQALSYDYLVIASGSETNFYGNDNIKQNSLTLDSADDAQKIVNILRQNDFDNFIVGGGGYTGIEVATNLRVYLDKVKRNGKIMIVERLPSILGPLPDWMKNYVAINLKKMNVEVCLDSTIGKIEGRRVNLSGGKSFNNALVIWSAGVRTAGFIQNLKLEKNPQGRIKVDEYLRINDHCFAVGDTALFAYNESPLRMAVQFAITQGECVAINIINSIKGISLKKFTPGDLGYIIPMANNKSCGVIFGLNLKGFFPTVLHFIMCIYRSYGIKNKLGIIRDLKKRTFTE